MTKGFCFIIFISIGLIQILKIYHELMQSEILPPFFAQEIVSGCNNITKIMSLIRS
jgi:hypothetical protein